MERKAQDAAGMAAQLEADRKGKLYASGKKTYAEVSADLKAEALENSINHTQELLQKAYKRGRISLQDTDTVAAQADEYMNACKAAQVFPTLMGFAAALGISRQRVYKFCAENPRHPTTELLDNLRSAWAAILAQNSLTRQTDAATSIFLLKNSGQGLTDRTEIEISTPESPLGAEPDQAALEARLCDVVVEGEDLYE